MDKKPNPKPFCKAWNETINSAGTRSWNNLAENKEWRNIFDRFTNYCDTHDVNIKDRTPVYYQTWLETHYYPPKYIKQNS